jgi:CRISPR/Cas system CSM-associated protein Csm4 (group 5 of RAMP superfamily)
MFRDLKDFADSEELTKHELNELKQRKIELDALVEDLR